MKIKFDSNQPRDLKAVQSIITEEGQPACPKTARQAKGFGAYCLSTRARADRASCAAHHQALEFPGRVLLDL
ncbi:MAG: hypothetical protein PHP85_13965 [Gallionella sp.]|nr:hypothetical protein [Gallionella sp.]